MGSGSFTRTICSSCITLLCATLCLSASASAQDLRNIERACCFRISGECQFLTKTACQEAGGRAQRIGTDCENTDCSGNPVACCMRDGTCEDLPSSDCREQRGR